MRGRFVRASAAGWLVIVALAGGGTAAQPAKPGAIEGRVRLTGKSPGNTVIRMGLDPGCVAINGGRRVVQEMVKTGADGALANVFVKLQGELPKTPVPTEPVVVDQRGCVYLPRVVGARVGQTLEVRNSDQLLHNVHSRSAGPNGFNVGQPQAGVVSRFRLNEEPGMLRLACDVHRWMTAYVGVVSHPYFAVTSDDGTFRISGVPPGTYTIQAWHERYGDLSETVRVAPGGTAAVAFAYEGTEAPARPRPRE